MFADAAAFDWPEAEHVMGNPLAIGEKIGNPRNGFMDSHTLWIQAVFLEKYHPSHHSPVIRTEATAGSMTADPSGS